MYFAKDYEADDTHAYVNEEYISVLENVSLGVHDYMDWNEGWRVVELKHLADQLFLW